MHTSKTLLVANNYPPVQGGSAVVYDNMAKFSNGQVIVLASRLDYTTGRPLSGWQEHDAQTPAKIFRLPLLRTPIASENNGSAWKRVRFLVTDVMIRLRVIGMILWLISTQKVRHVCIGELVASAWIVDVLRALMPNLKLSVYVHGEEITTLDTYDPSGLRRSKTLLKVDHIIVVSRFTFRAVQSLVGPEVTDRIRLIENGVDTKKFLTAPKNHTLVKRYGLGAPGDFVFVTVCRMLEKKGVDNAIHAFATVMTKIPNSFFLVVGDGPYLPELKALAKRHDPSGRAIVFAGQVSNEELADHYRLGEVFVMPNRALENGDTEGFGLVFLEANACGLPVIAGCDGGSIDVVSDGQNGLVVNGRNIDAIAAAMLRLGMDAALWLKIRSNGLRVASLSDWRAKAKTFVALAEHDDQPTDASSHGRTLPDVGRA